MGSPPQRPTPPSFSPFEPFVTLLAAAPPGRDGSTADSFPFDDNRDEKQKEGILEIIKSSDSGSEKAARHDETCLAQVADEEGGSEHNLRTLARSVLDFLSVLKGLAQHNLQFRILDSGASMHATGILRLLSEFTRAPGGSSAAVYHTRDGKDLRIAGAGSFSPIDADAIPFFLPVISCGSPGPQRLDVQLERVIAAFDNRKLIPKHIKHMKDGTVVGGAILQDDGMYELLTGIVPSSIDMWAVCADGTHLCIVGTGTLRMDGFSIPDVRFVYGLKKNLISVSQLCSPRLPPLDLILDSGASMHATGNLRLLSEFTRAPGGSSAAVYHTRDGKDLRIAGVGMIARDKFHLPNVHYVPELGSRFTLASVQLLAGCDYLVMFCGGWCYVKNRNNGSLVGRGRMHDEDGLYHLEYLRIPLVVVDGAN